MRRGNGGYVGWTESEDETPEGDSMVSDKSSASDCQIRSICSLLPESLSLIGTKPVKPVLKVSSSDVDRNF